MKISAINHKLSKRAFHTAAAALVCSALCIGMTGCDEELDRPPIDIPHTDWKANTSILDLKTSYWSNDRNYATEIAADGNERVIIGGRVIASDSTGNVYKTVYLQDNTSAVAIAVDTTKLYLRYKVGEEMYFDVTGLYAGKYNGLFQIGYREAYNNAWETSQMKGSDFYSRSRLNGLPDLAKVDTIRTSLARVMRWTNNPDSVAIYVGQLIRLDDITIEGGGSLTFSEFGTSSNRTVADASGNSVTLRNSSFATFAQDVMPEGWGSMVCVLSFYGTSWQLLLRSPEDLFGFHGSASDLPESAKGTFEPASQIESGMTYIFVNSEGKVAIPIAASYTYGYLYVEDPLSTSGTSMTVKSANALTFTNTDKGWTITDSFGRYLSMEGTYTSFQLYSDTPREGSYWKISAASDGNAMFEITNILKPSYTIRWVEKFSNFAPSSNSGDMLPAVYVKVN